MIDINELHAAVALRGAGVTRACWNPGCIARLNERGHLHGLDLDESFMAQNECIPRMVMAGRIEAGRAIASFLGMNLS